MKDPSDIFEVFDPKDYVHFNQYQGTIRDEYDPGCSIPPTHGSRIWDWSSLIISAVSVVGIIVYMLYCIIR